MKRLLMISFLASTLMMSLQLIAQDDKSKRPSPPAIVSQHLNSVCPKTLQK